LSEEARTDRVPAEQLQDASDRCPICASRRQRVASLRLQEDPPVELLDCASCGASSASHFPDERFLKALYAPSAYASDLLSSSRAIEHTARHIASHVPLGADYACLRILDYGGGDGRLSTALRDVLREEGHLGEIELTVVDYFVDERANEDVRFLDVTDFAALDETFDLVIASAVLEHLVDLAWTARKLLSLCAVGGHFYARAPYEAPLARLVPGYRVRWPRHLHDLGPAFWAGFLDTLGFDGALLRSAPSVIESDFRSKPLRTSAAWLMKLPARLEALLLADRIRSDGAHHWPWAGGWEAVLRIDGPRR
jgi:SAM-dependent methyltransferase